MTLFNIKPPVHVDFDLLAGLCSIALLTLVLVMVVGGGSAAVEEALFLFPESV